MAVDSSLPVGATGESLETVKTAANVHREGMFLGDPITDAARARIVQAAPDGSQYGLAAYVLGSVTVTSSALPTGAATAARQDTGNTSLASIDAHLAGVLAVNTGLAQGLTDAQLRAAAVPISHANLDATISTRATEATLAAIKAKTDNIDVLLSTRTKPADVQHVALDSSTVTTDHVLTFAGDKVDASGSSVAVSASALPAGATTDANLTALVGAVSSTPAANTIAERLYQLGLKLDAGNKVFATEATMKKVLAALQAPVARPYTTLLHGR